MRTVAGFAIAAMAGTAVVVVVANGERWTGRAAAEHALGAAALAQAASAKLASGETMAAELYAAEALSIAPDPRALGSLLWLASRWRPRSVLTAAPVCRTAARVPRRDLLACGGEHELLFIEPTTGEVTARIAGAGADSAIAISPRGTLIGAGSFSSGLGVWDTESGQRLWRAAPGTQGAVIALAFAADGSQLLVGGDGERARILDAATGEAVMELSGHQARISSVASAADGEHLATGSWDQTVRLWRGDGEGPEGVLVGHTAGVTDLAFAPDGARLASAGADHRVRLWRLDTGEEIRLFSGHRYTVNAIAWSDDGELIASGDATGAVRIWDVATGRTRSRLTTWGAPVDALGFCSADRELWVAAAGQPLHVWDLDGMPPTPPASDRGDGSSIAAAAGAELFATTHTDGSVRLWGGRADVAALSRLRHPAAVRAATFSPDGELLATGCDDGALRLWRVGDGGLDRTIALPGGGAGITGVAFTPDGKGLVCSRAGATAPFVDLRLPEGEALGDLTTGPGDGRAVAASPDGRWLAGGTRRRVYLWEAHGGREVWHRDIPRDRHGGGVQTLAFRRDGRELYAAGWDGAVHRWRVPSGREATPLAAGPGLVDVAASDDLLAAGGADGAWLWDILSRRLLAHLATRTEVRGVVLAADGAGIGILEGSGAMSWVDLAARDRPAALWLARAREELGPAGLELSH